MLPVKMCINTKLPHASVNSLYSHPVQITCVTGVFDGDNWLVDVMSDGKMATQLAKDSDIHVITGLLKLYFRELPESLFTDTLYPSLVTGMGTADSLLCMIRWMYDVLVTYRCSE